MNEEQNSDEQKLTFSDYLPSIGIVGLIFSLISFAVGLFFGYQQINSEPTGSFFSPAMLSSGVICLVSAFAGLIAVWHFTREVTPKIKLGQGGTDRLSDRRRYCACKRRFKRALGGAV